MFRTVTVTSMTSISLAGQITAAPGLQAGVPDGTATTVEVLAEGIPAEAAPTKTRLMMLSAATNRSLISYYLRSQLTSPLNFVACLRTSLPPFTCCFLLDI
jgi:hypothetical protein